MKLALPKFFQNKFVLYGVSIFAGGNVLGYLAKEQYNAATFFLAIGLLTSYFTKNMTVVLLTAIVTTALFSSQKMIEGFTEGLADTQDGSHAHSDTDHTHEGGATTEEPASGGPSEVQNNNQEGSAPAQSEQQPSGGTCSPKPETTEEDAIAACTAATTEGDCSPDTCVWNPAVKSMEDKVASEKAKVDAASEQGPPASEEGGSGSTPTSEGSSGFTPYCLAEGSEDDHTHTMGEGSNMSYFKSGPFEATCGEGEDKRIKCETEGACSTYIPRATGFTNMGKRDNIVGSVAREARVDGVDESVGDRIDHAATTKQAFQNLQKMLGSDGMKGLAAETKNLVAQQKELVDSLGQMAPVLKSAKSTLDSLNLPDMKGITNILSTLKGGN